MAKLTNPLGGEDARGKLGKGIIYRRGKIATRYHVPRDPKTVAQLAARQAFKEMVVSYLTQAQADVLYAAIVHLHDDRYSLLSHNHSATYAPIAKGVTNGDGHDHVGGDGGTVSYAGLAGRPVAETNANNIFGCTAAGASAFAGTIATLPGGAPTTLTYNAGFTGSDLALVPTATTQLGKMRLYNTTRGTSAKISNAVVATKTITFTANVPAGWTVGDVITIASQTVTGGGVSWADIEITVGPTGKNYLFVLLVYKDTTTAGLTLQYHPLEAYAVSKAMPCPCVVANLTAFQGHYLIKVVNNVFAISWQASGANTASVVIREAGYLE